MHFTKTLITFSAAIGSALASSGEATYYYAEVAQGACGYTSYTLPAGITGVALGSADFAGGSSCGKCISVDGPNGKVMAMAVDLCGSCGSGDLDLFSQGFSQIGNQAEGVIPVSWSFVDCGTSDLPTGGNYD